MAQLVIVTASRMGNGDVVGISNPVATQRVSIADTPDRHAPADGPADDALAPLATIAADPWRALAARAIEPNAYYLADWELAVNATAKGRAGVFVLSAWDNAAEHAKTPRLIGLLPVVSAWSAYRLPISALASADPYGTLNTPLLDRKMACEAVTSLLRKARDAGARALILRDVTLNGAAMKALTKVLHEGGIRPHLLQSHSRACLDATRDAGELLHHALGTKKLKELRRQRNRLADHGEVTFQVARTADEVAAAVETFLILEASGWKARRGTALNQHAGDAAFIRRATVALAERGECEVVVLRAGDTPVAAAIITRHLNRAFYFKLGIDENFAKLSPGVQLTLDLTRHLCADPAIVSVDSTASPGHPMIGPIWRGRLAIGDVLIPLRPRDPVVSAIKTILTLRRLVREPLRRAIHALRNRQEKST